MPIYEFECRQGHVTEREFRIAEAPQSVKCAACKRRAKRRIPSSIGFSIPAYMRAPGSIGSSANAVDRQSAYLQSDRHRKNKAQEERMARHDERIADGKAQLDKNLADAQARTDREIAIATDHGRKKEITPEVRRKVVKEVTGK